jgi:hypothetical protein
MTSIGIRSALFTIVILVAGGFCLSLLQPQKGKGPKGDCPYCENDPVLLKGAGMVSHGPIDFGPENGSEGIKERLALSDWLFLESDHMRWASSLRSETLKGKDRKRLAPELDALREQFPLIPTKVKKLDPYLRLHLMAARGEKFYARFQQLLGVTDADFPESRQFDKPYMGNGRFLGEKDKFEVILHSNRGMHQKFTKDHMGTVVTDTLRWHFRGQHKMLASIPAVDADLRNDKSLYPHTVHNLSHLMLCAYKHFSYDPPIWLDEGLAHVMEHEIDNEFHTLDGEEGSMPDNKGAGDWDVKLKKLQKRGEVTSFGRMLRIQTFGEMSQEDHVSTNGMVRFLIDEHPDKFASFIGAIKGQLNAEGYPDGSDLKGLQRKQLKELWGLTPNSLDVEFHAWIEAR